jgi:hypothetical protein
MELEIDGPKLTRRPPEILGEVPLELPTGRHLVRVGVEDEDSLTDVTVWFDGDKVAWTSPGQGALTLDVPVHIEPGSHQMVVRATDVHGVSKRRIWWIRGLPAAGDQVGEGSP